MNVARWIELGSTAWWGGLVIFLLMSVVLFCVMPSQKSRYYDRANRGLGIVIFLNQAWYWVMAFNDQIVTVQESLPLHMCSITQLLLFALLTWRQTWVFTMVLFWGPIGGIQAILTPYVHTDLLYFLQYYIAHSLVAVVPIYVLIRSELTLPKQFSWIVFGVSNAVVVVMIQVNALLGSNYWYVSDIPPIHAVIETLSLTQYIVLADCLFLFLILGLGRLYNHIIRNRQASVKM